MGFLSPNDHLEASERRDQLACVGGERAGGVAAACKRELAQLLEGPPSHREGVGLRELGCAEHLRCACAGGTEEVLQLQRGAVDQRHRTLPCGLSQAVHGVQRPVLGLPARAGLRGGAHTDAADLALEGVGELGASQYPRRAQPREQLARPHLLRSPVFGPWLHGSRGVCSHVLAGHIGVREGDAQQPEEGAPDGGVGEGDAALHEMGDAVGGEHLAEQLGDRLGGAVRDGDLVGAHSAGEELLDVLRDELELGAFPSALQQPHGLPGTHGRRGGGLEEVALEVVQRGAGGGRVVLRAGRDAVMLGGEGE